LRNDPNQCLMAQLHGTVWMLNDIVGHHRHQSSVVSIEYRRASLSPADGKATKGGGPGYAPRLNTPYAPKGAENSKRKGLLVLAPQALL
jgi:hypothetical protein